MATVMKRNKKFVVIYYYKDRNGVRKQKWETYKTKREADRRRKEIDYKWMKGEFVVPTCRTLSELCGEYVNLYGKDKWSVSSYRRNLSLINNYIKPVIGNTKISDINARFLERYYQSLAEYPAIPNPFSGEAKTEYVTTGTINKIHVLLKSCFNQAVKWDLMEKNPALKASAPKRKDKKREIWDAETLLKAMDACKNERLKLAIALSFSCTLRLGELLGLTWDGMDISEEAIRQNRAYIFVDKELQRADKDALKVLSNKDVLVVFPEASGLNKTVRILKAPKTESSIRKIFLPKTVALMLVEWKKKQDEMKEVLGEEYKDFGLVFTSTFGLPLSHQYLRKAWWKLIDENNLDPVVFHTLRHTSVTYKLKLSGGDIKSVQGDSGHAQVNMVTNVYSHILDDERRKNAELFEDAFFKSRTTSIDGIGTQQIQIPAGIDPSLLNKILTNPEMMALLTSMANALK